MFDKLTGYSLVLVRILHILVLGNCVLKGLTDKVVVD